MVIRSRRTFCGLVLTLLLLGLLSIQTWATSYPSPTREFYVNDYAHVLSTSVKQHIISIATDLERATTAQVVVVTVENIENQSLEEYSLGLFREWEIGNQQDDNGLLIFLDIGGRQSRIEVGFGLEGALPDGKTGRIQDNYMIPYFQNGDYSKGIMEGFNALVNEIYLEYGINNDQLNPLAKATISPIFVVIGLLLIVPLIILDFKFTGGAFTYMFIRMASRGNRSSGRGIRPSGRGGSGGGGGSSRRF
ncbi:TPM domain-containing protein [Alkaliphilus transvaalensis]|uniref:TPM domain-containing protein n=1 Tax=Alkaliphilus transvaalensis TaxID=114628 RepID=UPI0006854D93|nr:TPM domain-containing protein [Alkaliphilus transvaalensis]